MSFRNNIHRAFESLRNLQARHSYAQRGEDLIIADILKNLKITRPSYLDIGAHHPTYLSNTYYFYRAGAHGVCIEPNPLLAKQIKRKRSRDIVLPIGVGSIDRASSTFYIMSTPTLSTFSKTEAETYLSSKNYGDQKIEQIVKIPQRNINSVIKEYLNNRVDLLSVDTEGMDYEIITSIDFSNCRPVVICVETGRKVSADRYERDEALIRYLETSGYIRYADTHINSIFIDSAYPINF
jgi:FkbM family methyltransferase